MKEVFATNSQIAERVATRHAGYVDDLRPAITRRGEGGIWVDVEHPAYVMLAARYQPASVWGPPLWSVLHTKVEATAEWLSKFVQAIPCGDCRSHFEGVCRDLPPDYGAGWFAWTVRAHNAVNERLKKRQWEEAEATRRWQRSG